MTYTALLTPDSILLGVEAGDRDAVLAVLADTLARQQAGLAGRRDEVFEALRAREDQGSTGSQGVAIPHVKLAGLEEIAIVVAVHSEGVDFNATDGELVHVLFSVVRPQERADEHLDVLRWIAGIAGHEDFVPFSRQAESAEQLLELLSELSPA